MNINDVAINIIKNNPNIANNEMAKDLINVIETNDYKRGEEIAMNMCNTYGVTKEQAIQKAIQFFGLNR